MTQPDLVESAAGDDPRMGLRAVRSLRELADRLEALQVARARELGLDVIVTDHHRPGESLPACPIVATRPSQYPFPELCGTGVVYTLLRALVSDESTLDEHLDLVGLATVADVVPLVDENRGLVAAGLRRLARTTKPGLRALMRAAGVDPATVDCGACGFRLAPRINAAGRLCHPGAALDLLLTEDAAEAERFLVGYRGTTAFWHAPTRFADGFELTGVPETGINVDWIPGPRGPVTYRDLWLRQYRIVGDATQAR
jgi:single-stranded-DNA-specific exonuclease